MKCLSKIFPRNGQNELARELRLAQAYRNVFRGEPSKDCQDIVLADLAYHSGFSMVTPAAATDAELRHNEGKRHLFARITVFLNLGQEDVYALEVAARTEAAQGQTF